MLGYLEKFINSETEIEEVEKKLYDYANLNELMEIIKNIFNDLTDRVNKALKTYNMFFTYKKILFSKDLFKTDETENICPEDYTKLEKILQKHEGEIRNHISV